MNRYFEEMVLSASPVELIRLLYQKAIASTQAAREHLKAGQIAKRGDCINNAYMIVSELSASLRSEAAPELAMRLAALYAYMQNRLLTANLLQEDAPLAEVSSLLFTLSEPWGTAPEFGELTPESWQTTGSETRIAMTA